MQMKLLPGVQCSEENTFPLQPLSHQGSANDTNAAYLIQLSLGLETVFANTKSLGFSVLTEAGQPVIVIIVCVFQMGKLIHRGP